MPPSPAPSPSQDTSHIRMIAWMAVAAVAASSGIISYSASAAASPQADPHAMIMKRLNGLQAQGSRIEEALNRIEKELQDQNNASASGDTMDTTQADTSSKDEEQKKTSDESEKKQRMMKEKQKEEMPKKQQMMEEKPLQPQKEKPTTDAKPQ